MQPKGRLSCQTIMKIILVSTFIISLFCSCKKDRLESYKNQFSGQWEYVRYAGYPFNSIPLPPGNGNIIVLTKDGSFEKRNHDTITFKGQYYLEEKKDCFGEDKKIFVRTNDPLSGIDGKIESTPDTLVISSSNCLADGGLSIYRRL
jgi:hypothetical protein